MPADKVSCSLVPRKSSDKAMEWVVKETDAKLIIKGEDT